MLPFRIARAAVSPDAHAVDVWSISLDRPSHVVAGLEAVLDASERARARRLWEGPLRSRFIVAHAAARHILSRYLGTSPAAIQFDRLPSGKPGALGGNLTFSLSHSGGLAILAVSYGGRIGVDVEQVRSIADADNIVSQMFSPAEARQYAAFPQAERVAAWFTGWTRKAALLKATGERAQRPFSSFDVDLSPTASLSRVNVGAEDDRWFLRSFSPTVGFTAAVAGDFPIHVLNHLDWPCPADLVDRLPSSDRLRAVQSASRI